MFSLILVVIIGLGIALFAQQNTQTVLVAAGNYSFAAVPVYLIVVISMLIGLVVAWILSMMNYFSTSRLLRQKDGAISKEHNRVEKLESELEKVRNENTKLRGETRSTRDTYAERDVNEKPRNFIADIRERLSSSRRTELIS